MNDQTGGKKNCFYNIPGEHETQMSEGGEAELHKCLVLCKKNPGHTQFVPVESFSIEHLPRSHRDEHLYEVIKYVADLTVRIDVKMTSPGRPEFWPDTKVPYPFYQVRGSEMLRLGSGRVYEVTKCTDVVGGDGEAVGDRACCCHRCQSSNSPSKVWWNVEVLTAAHVVFDKLEAGHTSCRLFYDTKDSPLYILDMVKIEEVSLDRDWCKLNCVTCDTEIIDKLIRTRTHLSDNWRCVYDKFKTSRDEDRLAFMVSHPHGCPKQISIGQWIKKHQFEDDFNKFTYTTCTCPGSSGATVHCVGYSGRWSRGYQLVHSGTSDSDNNFSGVGRVW
uniref:Uncharacterized protein n=1 Tax=Biomphalaria glabrata TaxID=6526 RepID=A0A2C9LEF2_BIOGL